MNKKIKQLVEISGGEVYIGFAGSPNSIKFTEDEFQKFIELFIKKSSILIRDTNLEDVEGGDSAVLQAASEQFQRYFGVQ